MRRSMGINDHDDRAEAHIDAGLEALARSAPPDDHVARVLARTGPESEADASRRRLLVRQRARWLLPVAATLLAVVGTTWQLSRPVDFEASGQSGWGTPRDIDRPVLPPEAYWGMDPFQEFRTLRPVAGPPRMHATREPHRGRDVASARADDEHAWSAVVRADGPASDLPALGAIELTPIQPPPLDIAPLAANDAIALPEITFDPIVMTPLAAEERP